MSNLRNLLGNGSRYVFGTDYSNLEDYKEWDNGLVYRKYGSVKRNRRLGNRGLGLFLRVFLLIYVAIGIGFVFMQPSLAMFLNLACGTFMFGYQRCLDDRISIYSFRAKKLAGEILGFEHRDKLWGETESFPRDRLDEDQGKRIEFYKNILDKHLTLTREGYLSMLLGYGFLILSLFINPNLLIFGWSLIGLDKLRRIENWNEYGNNNQERILDDLNVLFKRPWYDIVRDDGFRSYLSFGRYLLSFGRSEHGILTGWIYQRIYDWHFKPSRLERLIHLNENYRNYYDNLKVWIREEYYPFVDIEDAEIIGSKGDDDTWENVGNLTDLNLSPDGDGSDVSNIEPHDIHKDLDFEKMETLILSFCKNWSLFNKAWLALFRRDEWLRDEYLDSPLMDGNQMILIDNFNYNSLFPIHEVYEDGRLRLESVLSYDNMNRSIYLSYLDTIVDLESIFKLDKHNDTTKWSRLAVMSILDFKNRNELDMLVDKMGLPEWDRIAMDKVHRDIDNLDKREMDRIHQNWRILKAKR